jgi:hypothetical protein
LTHSVSHNLILELNDNDLIIVVVNKDNLVIDLKSYPLIDTKILKDVLFKLPDIYSDISLLVRKKQFITIPESFYGNDLTKMYTLSYNLVREDKLILDKTEYNIGVVFSADTAMLDLILYKFPRVKIHHEATIIINKIFLEIGLKQPRILISINDDSLLIFAIIDGKLALCNIYSVKSNDDIFYFVMLTMEQLHFTSTETELVILGEPPHRSDIFDLFKNYIKEINIWLENVNLSDPLPNKHIISQSFALQNVLCE